MSTRKILLGVGLAVLVPTLVYRGIELANPRPAQTAVQLIKPGYSLQKPISLEEIARLKNEQDRLHTTQLARKARWSRTRFFLTVLIGVAVTVLGALAAVPGVAGGLLLGGAFTFVEGCAAYWSELGRWGQFGMLAMAVAVLVWIGYRKAPELPQPNSSAPAA